MTARVMSGSASSSVVVGRRRAAGDLVRDEAEQVPGAGRQVLVALAVQGLEVVDGAQRRPHGGRVRLGAGFTQAPLSVGAVPAGDTGGIELRGPVTAHGLACVAQGLVGEALRDLLAQGVDVAGRLRTRDGLVDDAGGHAAAVAVGDPVDVGLRDLVRVARCTDRREGRGGPVPAVDVHRAAGVQTEVVHVAVLVDAGELHPPAVALRLADEGQPPVAVELVVGAADGRVDDVADAEVPRLHPGNGQRGRARSIGRLRGVGGVGGLRGVDVVVGRGDGLRLGLRELPHGHGSVDDPSAPLLVFVLEEEAADASGAVLGVDDAEDTHLVAVALVGHGHQVALADLRGVGRARAVQPRGRGPAGGAVEVVRGPQGGTALGRRRVRGLAELRGERRRLLRGDGKVRGDPYGGLVGIRIVVRAEVRRITIRALGAGEHRAGVDVELAHLAGGGVGVLDGDAVSVAAGPGDGDRRCRRRCRRRGPEGHRLHRRPRRSCGPGGRRSSSRPVRRRRLSPLRPPRRPRPCPTRNRPRRRYGHPRRAPSRPPCGDAGGSAPHTPRPSLIQGVGGSARSPQGADGQLATDGGTPSALLVLETRSETGAAVHSDGFRGGDVGVGQGL
ncbi:hypothetical protein ACWDUK_30540 [Streptomyces cellulosae]